MKVLLKDFIPGKRFNKWTVVEDLGNSSCICRCDCGIERVIRKSIVRKGRSKGCMDCRVSHTTFAHGREPRRLYRIWQNMKNRCRNKNKPDYSRYGGRGIYVCQEWSNDFVPFRDWALSHGYAADLSVDRIDNDGPYCPENCRWATDREQWANKSITRWVEFRGERVLLEDLTAQFKISHQALSGRIRNGWSIEDAVTLPVDRAASTARRHARRRAERMAG